MIIFSKSRYKIAATKSSHRFFRDNVLDAENFFTLCKTIATSSRFQKTNPGRLTNTACKNWFKNFPVHFNALKFQPTVDTITLWALSIRSAFIVLVLKIFLRLPFSALRVLISIAWKSTLVNSFFFSALMKCSSYSTSFKRHFSLLKEETSWSRSRDKDEMH